MIPVWLSEKNRVNLKLVDVFNIPNDNLFLEPTRLELNRAFSFREKGYFQSSYALARKLFFRSTINQNKAAISLLLADVCRQRDQFAEARHWYSQAKRFANESQTNDANMGEALCWRAEGQYRRAIERFLDLGRRYAKNNDQEGLAFCYWALGTTHRFRGELLKAKSWLQKSLTLYRKINNQMSAAYSQAALGGTLRMQGRYQDSLALYCEAFNVFCRFKDQFGKAYALCGRSNALRMQGELIKGLKLSKQAERLYRKLKQKSALGFVLWSQAQFYIGMAVPENSKKCLNEAEILFRKSKDSRGLVYVDLGWGEYFRSTNRSAKAALYYRKAIRNGQKLNLQLEVKHARARLKHRHYLATLP